MKRWLLLAGLMSGLLGGCRVDDETAIAAINAVNTYFQACYEQTLANDGTRTFNLSTQRALSAMTVTMSRLNMEVVETDHDIGYLKAVGPAPLPLDEWEWRRARNTDLPAMRKIIVDFVGTAGHFVNFEPEGLNVALNIVVVEHANEADISITMRFQELAPPKQGYPRRSYPPCEAMRIGLTKIWNEFDDAIVRYANTES